MPPAKFTSISQLSQYLSGLEARLDKLEYENENLKEALNQTQTENQELRQSLMRNDMDEQTANKLRNVLPETALLSPNFLSRAFAVWGHYFVAQLIISIGIFAVYVVVVMLVMRGITGR